MISLLTARPGDALAQSQREVQWLAVRIWCRELPVRCQAAWASPWHSDGEGSLNVHGSTSGLKVQREPVSLTWLTPEALFFSRGHQKQGYDRCVTKWSLGSLSLTLLKGKLIILSILF